MIRRKTLIQKILANEDRLLFKILFICYLFSIAIITWFFILSPVDRNVNIVEYNLDNPLKKLIPVQFDFEKEEWIDFKQHKLQNEKETLSLITWNVWHGNKREKSNQVRERISVLSSILENEKPDLITLQEITKPILEVLSEEIWIREFYWISDHPINRHTFANYGTILLGRKDTISLKQLELQTLPLTGTNRKLIKAIISKNGKEISLITTHLESYPLDTSTRFEQMKLINFYNPDIIFGDLNIANEKESINIIPLDFQDIFQESEKTVLLNKNPIAYVLSQKENDILFLEDRRPDRILISKRFSVENTKVIGQLFKENSVEQIKEKLPKPSTSHIYIDSEWPPSDHFGLFTKLKINSF